MKRTLARLLATGLGAVAVIFVTTACYWIGHRAEVPQELLEK
jgi:cyclic lactone autoinducer peptide